MKHHKVKDSIWPYLCGLVDSNDKLKNDISRNPKVLFSLMKPIHEKFGKHLSIETSKEAIAYVVGYLDVPWDDICDVL